MLVRYGLAGMCRHLDLVLKATKSKIPGAFSGSLGLVDRGQGLRIVNNQVMPMVRRDDHE